MKSAERTRNSFKFSFMTGFISRFGLCLSDRLATDPTPASVAPFDQPHATDRLVEFVVGSSVSFTPRTFIVAIVAVVRASCST